jgi:septum formation protein
MLDTSQYNVILGSQSSRRAELLELIDLVFSVFSIEADESYPKEMESSQIAAYLAHKKSMAYTGLKSTELLITADTIVIDEGEVLGKPNNEKEANTMLQRLSGKKHEVITGVCLRTENTTEVFQTKTTVSFKTLKSKEIDFYVGKYKPFDKAGAYGIQEWIGAIGVDSIEGCFYNVMGLPVQQLYSKMEQLISNENK